MINMPRMSHTRIRLPSLITIFTVTVTIVLLSLCVSAAKFSKFEKEQKIDIFFNGEKFLGNW